MTMILKKKENEEFKSSSIDTSIKRKNGKTSVTIRYDVGFGNALYLRGRGANLSWDKGVMLRNVNNDEWIWETDANFTNCEFKALINDNEYEIGENHLIKSGEIVQYTPDFNR